MARSTYVYIIYQCSIGGHSWPIATFTVKHEAMSWHKRYKPVYINPTIWMELYRFQDNPSGCPQPEKMEFDAI